MTRDERIKLYRTVLRARGVPEQFIEPLATRNETTSTRLVVAFVWLATVIGASLAGTVFKGAMDDWLLRLLHPQAESYLLFWTRGSWLDVLLPALFISAIIFAAVIWLPCVPRGAVRAWPAYDPCASRLRTIQSHENEGSLHTFPALADFSGLNDDRAFLTAVAGRLPISRWLWGWSLTLVVAGVSILASCIVFKSKIPATSTGVTLEQIVIQDFGETRAYRLLDTRFVNVLCYDSPDNNRFSYRVVTDHVVISLELDQDRLHSLSPAQVLDRLEQFDRRLTGLGVLVHRMPASEADACIQRTAKALKLHDTRTLERLVYGA